jgi:hypothetical protein
MQIPRFHSIGEDDTGQKTGDFYALAFVIGSYAPTERSHAEAFHVLTFSPSKEFTRFSFETVSPDGHLFAYARGIDQLDSPEYALLFAFRKEQVPMHAWRLFPASSIDEATFHGDAKARSDYEAARSRVAQILYYERAHALWSAKFPAKPRFYASEADYPPPMTNTPEYQEISKYVLAAVTPQLR